MEMGEMALERLQKQIQFIIEIDKLKQIKRRTFLIDRSRKENAAEHSWHIAVMAILLLEYSNDSGVDLLRVLKMVLIHDLVEIDAGDTYCYDDEGVSDQEQRERLAADRIFNILPQDQARQFRGLWNEFEARKTPEARFAGALDRLQPILNNYHTGGISWRENNVKSARVVSRNKPIEEGSTTLWDYAAGMINDAVRENLLAK
jgi:putative hydrolase of HD superfamily